MGRRFLTAEDVRRLGGPAIAVDDDTVVTPQALEAAASLGIQIQSGSAGSYQAPTPDRGPDAVRGLATLSKLPEPGGVPLGDDRGVIVTVIGKNRPGVLAEITAHLAAAGCNIHKVSQEIVEGYFHLILTIELGPSVSFDQVKTDLEALGGPEDFVARAMHQRVFRFMHRI